MALFVCRREVDVFQLISQRREELDQDFLRLEKHLSETRSRDVALTSVIAI